MKVDQFVQRLNQILDSSRTSPLFVGLVCIEIKK